MILKFLFGCILIRSLFVIIAYKISKEYLPYLGILALIPALGFLLIYFDIIERSSGAFGQKIWWNNLRPIHALLYISFAVLAIKKSKYAYVPLLVDVLIAVIAFFVYHYYYKKKVGGGLKEDFKTRKDLLKLCGLPETIETSHCFADGTHHTCCELGPEARNYADRSGNPIGKASEKVSLKMRKNSKDTKPWCTCTGSKVCSNYANKFKDGTKIKFINNPNNDKIASNVSPLKEEYYRRKFNIYSHRTPGVY
tara:strand:+ start:4394 stop:5149 length:756 start_codon:yes stop_codon:yes gene_type:complete